MSVSIPKFSFPIPKFISNFKFQKGREEYKRTRSIDVAIFALLNRKFPRFSINPVYFPYFLNEDFSSYKQYSLAILLQWTEFIVLCVLFLLYS